MKNLKKLSGILLAIAVLLACTVSAFATSGVLGDNNGVITIKNTVKNETYSIYRIFDLQSFNTEPNTGVAPAYSYVVNSDWNDFINQPMINNVYVVVDGNGYVTWKEDANRVEFASLAFAYAEAHPIAPVTNGTKTSPADGSEVEFTGLPLGYYLIDSSVGTICALTTTNPQAEVIEKNPRPVLTKKVKEESGWEGNNDANIGDTVTFQATINVFGYPNSYVMHDEMSDGFEFKAITSITKNPDGTPYVLIDTDYTLKTSDLEHVACDFEIVFNDAFVTGLVSGDVIVVEYTAQLVATATVGATGNTNKAYLSYKDYNAKPATTTASNTTTYTWSFPVLKYANGVKADVLPNAKFSLYKDNAETQTIKFINTSGTNYRVATPDELSNGINLVTEITTDVTGKFTVEGLDSGTYYLKETVAPTGYNKLNTKVTVNIANNGNITLGDDPTPVPEVEVNNKSGSILPSTGGIGTTIFYIVGGVLVAAAVVLLVAKKRTSENR